MEKAKKVTREEILKSFYPPVNDATNSIELMKYINNGLSYGYTNEGKFCLCTSPQLDASIISIVSEHDNFQDLRKSFFENRN